MNNKMAINTYLSAIQSKKETKQTRRTETIMDMESIMLSEISQMVRDKYHMISPLTGT